MISSYRDWSYMTPISCLNNIHLVRRGKNHLFLLVNNREIAIKKHPDVGKIILVNKEYYEFIHAHIDTLIERSYGKYLREN